MKKGEKGVTLLELIVTIFILALLSSIIIPSFTQPGEEAILESTAQQLVQDIRWTQQLAIHHGRNYQFEIDLVHKKYYIRSSNPVEPSLKKVEIPGGIESITSTLAIKYSGSHKDYRVLSYAPTGIPSQTGTIILKTPSGKQRIITIAVATGRVMIVE